MHKIIIKLHSKVTEYQKLCITKLSNKNKLDASQNLWNFQFNINELPVNEQGLLLEYFT